ncbi:MAG: hypothetical protein OEY23_26280 [Acidimicrobiia bacterium]|nr:hypothetical protein [Acidimicrobiia bacterium]
MKLELDDSQVEMLREILDRTYRDLRYEISDTDNSIFKRGLRERETAVALLLDRLGGPLPTG